MARRRRAQGSEEFGCSMALDGDCLAVGAVQDYGAGSVTIFERSAGGPKLAR